MCANMFCSASGMNKLGGTGAGRVPPAAVPNQDKIERGLNRCEGMWTVSRQLAVRLLRVR